ncbi:MAG: tyrosine-type recombinase/integrase, partial [Clostridia bacterium]|nr:tyrosine-type recombinase/integrase [Clostridia bacterium]
RLCQDICKRYIDKAGLSQRGLSVHKLRHTAATLMYQSGAVDVRVLKDILGHAQLNTTQIYTHLSNRSMEDAMTKNPLSDLHLTESRSEGGEDGE